MKNQLLQFAQFRQIMDLGLQWMKPGLNPLLWTKNLLILPKISAAFSLVSVTRESPRFCTCCTHSCKKNSFSQCSCYSVVRHVPPGSHAFLQKSCCFSFVRQFPRFHAFQYSSCFLLLDKFLKQFTLFFNTPVLSCCKTSSQLLHASTILQFFLVPDCSCCPMVPSVSVVRQIPQTVHAVHNSPSVCRETNSPKLTSCCPQYSSCFTVVADKSPQAVSCCPQYQSCFRCETSSSSYFSAHYIPWTSVLSNPCLVTQDWISQFRFY